MLSLPLGDTAPPSSCRPFSRRWTPPPGHAATGADVVTATFRAFEEAGPPPGSVIGQGLMDVAIRTIIRTAKRSGGGLNSPRARPRTRRRAEGGGCGPAQRQRGVALPGEIGEGCSRAIPR